MIYVIAICSVYIIFLVYKWMRNMKRLPPGPFGLPLLGYYPFFKMTELPDLAGKYGDIMSINLLGKTYVILNSTDLLREAFVKKGEFFFGKPVNEFFIMKEVSQNNIATLEGDLLKLHQKAFTTYAAEAGMGKSEFENVIHNLVDEFVKLAKNGNTEVINCYEQCTQYVINVMSALIMNKHFEKDHPFSKKMNEFVLTFLEVSGFAFMSGPLVQIYVYLKHNFLKRLKKCKEEYYGVIQNIIDERLQTFDESNCRCMLDFYLKEQKGVNGKHFDMDTIKGTIVQLFFGGTLTTAFDVYSTLQQMASNESVQEKVYKEIEDVIGDGLVKYSDITRMPFTHAAISESQRLSYAVPITGIHVTTEDTTIGGYYIPKRTNVIANLKTMSTGEKYFKNPKEYDPSNFLDNNGEYIGIDSGLPYSIGCRRCPGAKLADVTIFIAFVTLLQEFEFKKPENSHEFGMLRCVPRSK